MMITKPKQSSENKERAMNTNEAHATATLDNGCAIELRKDADAYRWYEVKNGADTEVSGPSVDAAIETACLSWRELDEEGRIIRS